MRNLRKVSGKKKRIYSMNCFQTERELEKHPIVPLRCAKVPVTVRRPAPEPAPS